MMKRVAAVSLVMAVLLGLSLLVAGPPVWQALGQPIVFSPNPISPTIDNAYDLGFATFRWRDTYQTGHSIYSGGTAPTCSTSCGTVATVVGTDTAQIWTLSATSLANPIVVTFNRAYGLAPACTAANQTSAANYVQKVLTTTTTVTVTFAAGPTAADKVSIICSGAGG